MATCYDCDHPLHELEVGVDPAGFRVANLHGVPRFRAVHQQTGSPRCRLSGAASSWSGWLHGVGCRRRMMGDLLPSPKHHTTPGTSMIETGDRQ